jgi:glucokinase
VERNGRAFGVDVGGTNVRAGLVDTSGQIVEQQRTATPDDRRKRLDSIIELVSSVAERTGVTGLPVGVGAAGLVDLDGVVRYAPNLDWRDAPLRAELADALGVHVNVENDAAAAAWGEYRVGAAQHAEGGALMLTVGTGVGGGLVIDDRLIRGATGIGGEFGHIIIDEGGPRCPCGNDGCLEAMASGTAIGRMAREAVDGGTDPDSALHKVAVVTGTAVTEAAKAGDQLAIRILCAAGGWLGVGIASLVNGLDPEVVIIGGGVLSAGDLLIEPAVEAYHARVIAREHRAVPPVLRAQLGDDAGLIGAALLAAESAS